MISVAAQAGCSCRLGLLGLLGLLARLAILARLHFLGVLDFADGCVWDVFYFKHKSQLHGTDRLMDMPGTTGTTQCSLNACLETRWPRDMP